MHCFTRFENTGYTRDQTVTQATGEEHEHYERIRMNQLPPMLPGKMFLIYLVILDTICLTYQQKMLLQILTARDFIKIMSIPDE